MGVKRRKTGFYITIFLSGAGFHLFLQFIFYVLLF